MKKKTGFLVAVMVALSLAFGVLAYGADVTGSWTVKDAYVSEMVAMTDDLYTGTPDCMVWECSDAQYSDEDTCTENEETWSMTETPLTTKQCFSKMVVQKGIRDQYVTWKRSQNKASAKETFNNAKETYRAADAAADSEEIEFVVEGSD